MRMAAAAAHIAEPPPRRPAGSRPAAVATAHVRMIHQREQDAAGIRRDLAQAALHGSDLAQLRNRDSRRPGRARPSQPGADASRLRRPAPPPRARNARRKHAIRRSRKSRREIRAAPSEIPCGAIRRRPESVRRRRSLAAAARSDSSANTDFDSARQFDAGVAAHGDHLRRHGNGDLFRRNRADFQAHGREDPLERVARACLPFPVPGPR